jgi:hypothetical protein
MADDRRHGRPQDKNPEEEPLADPALLHFDQHAPKHASKMPSLLPEGVLKRTLVYGTLGFLAASTIGAATSIANSTERATLENEVISNPDYVWLRTDMKLCKSYKDLVKVLSNIAPAYDIAVRAKLDIMIQTYFDVIRFVKSLKEAKHGGGAENNNKEGLAVVSAADWKRTIATNRSKLRTLFAIVKSLVMGYNLFWGRLEKLIMLPEDETNMEAKIRVAVSVMKYGILPVSDKYDSKNRQPSHVSFSSSSQHHIIDSSLIVYEPTGGVVDEYLIHYKEDEKDSGKHRRRTETEVMQFQILRSYNQMWMYLHLRWRPTMKVVRGELIKNGFIPEDVAQSVTKSYYSKLLKNLDEKEASNGRGKNAAHLFKDKLKHVESKWRADLGKKRGTPGTQNIPAIHLHSPLTEKISYFIAQAKTNSIAQTLLGNPYHNYSLHEKASSYLPTTVVNMNEFDTHASLIALRANEYGFVVHDRLRTLEVDDGPTYDFSSLSSAIQTAKHLVSTPLTKFGSSHQFDSDSDSYDSDEYHTDDDEEDTAFTSQERAHQMRKSKLSQATSSSSRFSNLLGNKSGIMGFIDQGLSQLIGDLAGHSGEEESDSDDYE